MQMVLNGARRQIELLRNLLVAQAKARQPDDLQFAGGQLRNLDYPGHKAGLAKEDAARPVAKRAPPRFIYVVVIRRHPSPTDGMARSRIPRRSTPAGTAP
ncbi:hypothetical protein D3C85_1412740 [compost metagenome]